MSLCTRSEEYAGLLVLPGSDRRSFPPDEGHPGERESGHREPSGSAAEEDSSTRPSRKLRVLWAELERSRRPASVRIGRVFIMSLRRSFMKHRALRGAGRPEAARGSSRPERMAAGAGRSKVRGPDAASRIAQAKRGPAAAFLQVQAALSDMRNQLTLARDEMSRAQESERRMWEECRASVSSATGSSRILFSVRSLKRGGG